MAALQTVKKLVGIDPIPGLETERREICAASAANHEKIDSLEARRMHLETWAEVEADDREILRLRWAIERAVSRIADIDGQLRELRNEKREQLRKDILSRYELALRAYRASIEPAIKAFAAIVAIHSELEHHGFANERTKMINLPHINGNPFIFPDFADKITAELARLAPKRPAPERITRPSHTHKQPAAQPKRIAQGKPHAAPRPLRNDPVPTSDDLVLVEYRRSNIFFPDGSGESRAGDRVAIPCHAAEVLFGNGGATPVKSENKAVAS